MTGSMEDFGSELSDFRSRIEELRAARALPESERLPSLDAALFELQHAADVLWPRYEALAAAGKRSGGKQDTEEQQLLRALFQRLPVAVVLLDRDAVVRRLNMTATRLFGMRTGYASGRALTGSLAHDGRAGFRSQVAAVARGEGARSLPVQLLRAPDPSDRSSGTLQVMLTALRPPQEQHSGVLAVFQHTGADGPVPDGPTPAPGERAPDLAEMTRHSQLFDLVDDVATELLAVTGPRNAAVDRDAVADRAAAVLHERFADWVVVDLRTADGTLRRTAVHGTHGALRGDLAAQDPAAAAVVADAVERGAESLHVHVETPEAFGTDPDGAPLLVRAEAGSLLCVPLSPPPDREPYGAGQDGPGTALGALTLLRGRDRPTFGLAEAGAVDRVARHLALALGPA